MKMHRMGAYIVIFSLSACASIDNKTDEDTRSDFRPTKMFLAGTNLNEEIVKINSIENLSRDIPDESDARIFNLILHLFGQDTRDKSIGEIETLKKEFLNLEQEYKFRRVLPEIINFIAIIDGEDPSSERFAVSLDKDKLRPFLDGIGGFNTYLALNGLVACHRDGRIQAVRFGEQRFYGKIYDYAYNENTGNAYLGFITEHTIDCKDGKQPISNKYVFHIVIEKNKTINATGFEECKIKYDDEEKMVIEDCDIMIDEEVLLPPAVQAYIKDRGLNYKLHANASSIKIIAAFKDGQLLGKNHIIYQRNPDSCIDIFFGGHPPTFELPEQEDYCMGRCADPPIINSGGA